MQSTKALESQIPHTQAPSPQSTLSPTPSQTPQTLQAQESHKRLDSFLCEALHLPKNQILSLIKHSLILHNGKPCKKGGIPLKPKDTITLLPPPHQEKSAESPLTPPSLPITILHEDEDILVLNKPSNLVIHHAPSVKESTLVDWLKAKGFSLSTLSGEERYGIIHRLDKDTTGAILIAKTNHAHTLLAQELKTRQMGRYYLAIITNPLKDKCTIECHLGRNPQNRLKMSKLSPIKYPQARYSKSLFVPICTDSTNSHQLIAIKLFTGRTHQIRAHLESISRHILGDSTYGYKGAFSGRIQLHAFLLYLTHPTTKKSLLIQAPIFDDMLESLQKNFDKDTIDALLQKPESLLSLF